jgi:hypothetical protein
VRGEGRRADGFEAVAVPEPSARVFVKGGCSMEEVTDPFPAGGLPFRHYRAKKPGVRAVSAVQQKILDQMRPGAWYAAGPRARIESCRALVAAGRCEMARIEGTHEELLLSAIMGNPAVQWFELYRRLS